ncbi:MAG: VPLPA-CTERM sorting domain-containing protein [Deltaproteobacteria bacterium]|nr:VPLPA-CTERM sorting domain-containing protein [Deltaproteobacteria bacterium]
MEKKTNKRSWLVGWVVGLVLLVGAMPAMAYTYGAYVGSSDMTGALSAVASTDGSTGITTTNIHTNNWVGDTLTLNWEITKDSSNLYTYNYTFTTTGAPDLSHIIIEVTDWTQTCAYPDLGGGSLALYSSTSAGASNPGMPSEIDGIKFGTGTISFTSYNAPVWGNFYAKGAVEGAWNTTFSADGEYLIARPDGGPNPSVPIPGALWLLGSGFGALLIGRRKKKQA